MLPSVPAVTLNLLGTPSLVVGGRVRLLERKAAGVLAYVCLEGQVTRERVAGLLWPSVPNHSARNNLRQVLWRLRSYGDLVVGEPLLALAAHVHADVTASLLAASALPASGPAGLGEPDLEQPGWEGELLAGKDFSDCPAFEEWLLAERERFRALRRDALWQRCRADQAAGDLGGALRRAARLLELDPLSEPAYRLIMTLHVGRGDRAAALEAFYACRETLRRELGVSPTPETLALADGIRSASGVDTPGLPTAPTWQPPLVGREAEWTRLNAALDAGQNVIVSGPPGVGKTRLLREVLRARGPVLCLASRPNDEAVPYLALGRLARQLLKAYEDAKVLGLASTPEPLEDWVRVGAAHLLPDLWSEEPGTEPLRSPAAQRRFLEAVTRLVTSLLPLALATQAGSGFGGPGSLMFDDDQWMDEASWEAWMFVFSQPEWRSLGVQVGMTFRQGELPFARLKTVARLVEGRAALTIELQPLREAGVQALTSAFLERQEPGPVAASLVGALWRHTGGNPLFVLETLRSLIDVGRLPGHGEELRALPVPPQLEPLLYRRLEGVPASALRLARVAAVAGSEFDAELAAYVMDLHPLDLVQPWAELEAAQIMSGSRFAHDLIAQAALRSVPLPVRALLHARIAAHLQSRTDTHPKRAAPEHLALHWEAAGQPNSAAPHWVKAGWVALSRGAWSDAAWDFRRAVIAGDSARESVLEAQYGLGMALRGQDPAQAEQAFQAVLLSTPGIRRQVETHAALAELYRLCGRLEDALTQIVRATELARGHLTEPEQADLCRAQFAIHLRAGQYAAAEKTILTAQALAPWRAEITNEHALLLWMAGRFSEAAQLYERFQVPATRGGQPPVPAWYAGNLGWTYWALGRLAEAEAVLALPFNSPASPFDLGVRQVHQATVSISQGRYRKALAELDAAEPSLRAYPPHLLDLQHRRGLLALYAGRYEEAAALLSQAVSTAQHVGDPVRLSLALSGLTSTYAFLKRRAEAEQWSGHVRALAVHVQVPLTQVAANHALALVASLGGEDVQAAALADAAVRQSRTSQMSELLARSLLLRARFGNGVDARADLLEAAGLAEEAGILDVHYQAARALSAADPAWRTPATRLYRQLFSLAPPDFLGAVEPPLTA